MTLLKMRIPEKDIKRRHAHQHPPPMYLNILFSLSLQVSDTPLHRAVAKGMFDIVIAVVDFINSMEYDTKQMCLLATNRVRLLFRQF
jgi:hypothetical protein